MTRRMPVPGPGASDREWGEHWRREQSRARYASRQSARWAAEWYAAARGLRVRAAWLTRRAHLWDDLGAPAEFEQFAVKLDRLGDVDLRRAFYRADSARDYGRYAQEAEQRWAALLARVAAWEAKKTATGADMR
jgi:hypothetical protein